MDFWAHMSSSCTFLEGESAKHLNQSQIKTMSKNYKHTETKSN